MSPSRSVSQASLLLLVVSASLHADVVYLKGAGSISGRITERSETTVMLDDGDGIVGVPVERIDRIVEGRSPLDEYDERAGKLGPADADGWRVLGRWAAHEGLAAQSREAYGNLLAVAPDDAEARDALGFVRLNGAWMTEEESYLARGFVKRDGEWMSASAAQSLDASDEARRDAERRAAEAESAAAVAEAEKRSQEGSSYSYPVYWGTWGYGLSYWPTSSYVPRQPVNRPAGRTRPR